MSTAKTEKIAEKIAEKITVERTESTQKELKVRAQSVPELPHLSSLMATEQTSGHGRLGRGWMAPPGNLNLSVLFRLEHGSEDLRLNLTWFPLFVGIQVREALLMAGVDAQRLQLKWPNDLWVDHRFKLGGVICEKAQNSIFVGIGVNILKAPAPALLEGQTETICLADLSCPITSAELRDHILTQLACPFSLEILRLKLSSAMIPKAGESIHWRDPELKSGIVKGLGGFGELRVMSEDLNHQPYEAQLFSEEVQLDFPSAKISPSK
jgi:biotin-[acetyl-CoA-carboxylase] ligase BirA-like protein